MYGKMSHHCASAIPDPRHFGLNPRNTKARDEKGGEEHIFCMACYEYGTPTILQPIVW